MPHGAHTRDLGRSRSWRKATVRSLAQAVLREGRIVTTRAKAKEAQRAVERLITLGKRGTLSARRRAMGVVNDAELVRRLFSELAPLMKDRRGGYTRVVWNGYRSGDGASLAILELVERPGEITPPEKPKGKEKPKPRPEKPKVQEKKVQPERPPQPRPREEKAPPEKRKGFIDGLRKFFRRRENP